MVFSITATADPPTWRFYLLGDFRIEFKGQPVSLPPYRTYGLLGILLLRPGAVSRQFLISALFPDLPENPARSRLSDLLWLVRNTLPGIPIAASALEVGIPKETRWLDVEHFLDLTGQAKTSHSVEACLASLDAYSGELLPGCLDDWLLAEREHLHTQFIETLRDTCQMLAARQQHTDVLPRLQRLAREEPYDEDAVCLLMKTYAALGQRGAALAAYERFANKLMVEMKLSPESETRAIAQAIRVAYQPIPQSLRQSAQPVSPDDLIQRARIALDAGEYDEVSRYLTEMHHNPNVADTDVHLVEIDLALAREDLDQAQILLQANQPRTSSLLARQARLSILRHNREAAHHAAAEALLLAHQANDPLLIHEALLELAGAESLLSHGEQAQKSLAQAFRVAEQLASPLVTAKTYLVEGRVFSRVGLTREAIASFRQAETLAREHNFRRILLLALRGIGANLYEAGRYYAALETIEAELGLWRDLGIRRREAETLTNLSMIYAQLGKTVESLSALEIAAEIFKQLGDSTGAAEVRFRMADSLLNYNEDLSSRAISLAQEALNHFVENRDLEWEEAAWSFIGFAHWVSGQYHEASQSFERVFELIEKLGYTDYLPKKLAYRGAALLGLGDSEQAETYFRKALVEMASSEPESDLAPEIYYHYAQFLIYRGESEAAKEYIQRAYQILVQYAAEMKDESARVAFFQRDLVTRRLMQEVYRYGLATSPVKGKIISLVPDSRCNDNKIAVTWTVDAGPADQALKQAQGAIVLRRTRLARMLREARHSGAHPTINQLSEILKISPRTIKRDLAALRRSPER